MCPEASSPCVCCDNQHQKVLPHTDLARRGVLCSIVNYAQSAPPKSSLHQSSAEVSAKPSRSTTKNMTQMYSRDSPMDLNWDVALPLSSTRKVGYGALIDHANKYETTFCMIDAEQRPCEVTLSHHQNRQRLRILRHTVPCSVQRRPRAT